ncbi:MAG: hypothetical protein RJB13_1207 [Pseudomonadota bacterium]
MPDYCAEIYRIQVFKVFAMSNIFEACLTSNWLYSFNYSSKRLGEVVMGITLMTKLCCYSFAGIIAFSVVPKNAFALSLSANILAGYEVLSYRDDPTKLNSGSVSVGDAFDQKSFTGPAYGLGAQVGVMRLDLIEPFINIDVMNSQLSKNAVSDGIASDGTFTFLHAGLGLGGRFWLGRSLNLTVAVNFSQSLSDKMKTLKKESSSGQSLGEFESKTTEHKKTAAQLGVSFLPFGSGLQVGAEARIGSGCFQCTTENDVVQKRAYLTRSGAVSVAWLFGQNSTSNSESESFEVDESSLKSRLGAKKKEILKKRKLNKKQVPSFEELKK